jgi:hypothetical protein
MKCETCSTEYDGRFKECPSCKDLATASIVNDLPIWKSFGQCHGGEEIIPGWILTSGNLVNVGEALSARSLGKMQDAFQVKTINRIPVMGDEDYG